MPILADNLSSELKASLKQGKKVSKFFIIGSLLVQKCNCRSCSVNKLGINLFPKTYLDFLGEGCREHERLTFSRGRHVILLHDSTNLRLESHVQHTIWNQQKHKKSVRYVRIYRINKRSDQVTTSTNKITLTLISSARSWLV